MTGQEILEVTTRSLVIAMYLAALIAGIIAVHTSTIWARRRSGIAIAIAALAWLVFYVAIIDQGLHDPTKLVLWSRIIHYITAASLIAMAGNIITSTKIDNGGPHITLTLENAP